MNAEVNEQVVALVLAAGSARRFGDRKVLADLYGRPLLTHVVTAATDSGLPTIAIIPSDDIVRTTARDAGAGTVVNPDATTGLSGSLAIGLSALPSGTTAAVVLLADQPTVAPTVIRALLSARLTAPDAPWRVRYVDGPGHPVALPRTTWGRMRTLHGDVGARALLDELEVREVPVNARRPPDVDVVADLEALRSMGPP